MLRKMAILQANFSDPQHISLGELLKGLNILMELDIHIYYIPLCTQKPQLLVALISSLSASNQNQRLTR